MSQQHWAIFIDNRSYKDELIDLILEGQPPKSFQQLRHKQGGLFSKAAVERFIDAEDRHGTKTITSHTPQALKSMSSGEQKKVLLRHLLGIQPDFLVLDNPFDNLDVDTQAELKLQLGEVSKKIAIIQFISRKTDLLPFIDRVGRLDGHELLFYKTKNEALAIDERPFFNGTIPIAPTAFSIEQNTLIDLKKVDVRYGANQVLKQIDWTIKKGEFWELRGKNGSGKTTILSMVTGENPKGYGQNLYIFGRKKGTGESVWEIKKKIGYFTPSMTDKFTGYHSVLHMLISGLTDSVGLYVKPTELQLRTAKAWLQLLGLSSIKDTLFHDLSMGQKRLVMCARAMIKHPPLLILDEPTAGLDDRSAALFVALVNKFAEESNTTIIFVSHRKEPGLEPQHIYELQMTEEGSLGKVIK